MDLIYGSKFKKYHTEPSVKIQIDFIVNGIDIWYLTYLSNVGSALWNLTAHVDVKTVYTKWQFSSSFETWWVNEWDMVG